MMQLNQALEHLRHHPDHDLASLCNLSDAQLDAAYGRAQQLMQTGLHSGALRVLTALVLLRPSQARYVRLLGFAYQHSNQRTNAYEAFKRANELDPRDGIAQLMRAECAVFALGQQAAKPQLQAALATVRPTPAHQPYILRATRLLSLCQTRAPAAGSSVHEQ